MNLPDTARIAPLAADDPRSQNPQLEDLVAFVGYRPNALLTMARKPGVLPAVLGLVQTTLRGEGLIEPGLRFLLAAEACRGARCAYSAVHVVHAAQHAGVDWAQLDALPLARQSGRFSERECAALAIASAGATLPVADAGLAFDAARPHFSDDELIEIVAIVALFGWFNRWNSLMQSTLESVPAEALHHVDWLRRMMEETRP